MSEDPSLQTPTEFIPEDWAVQTSNGDSEHLLLRRIGTNLYRREESSICLEAVFGDVIRATDAGDHSLLFHEVVERSPLVTNTFVLSQDVIESPRIKAILNEIMSAGGNWEQIFGGVLIIHTSVEISERVTSSLMATESNVEQKGTP